MTEAGFVATSNDAERLPSMRRAIEARRVTSVSARDAMANTDESKSSSTIRTAPAATRRRSPASRTVDVVVYVCCCWRSRVAARLRQLAHRRGLGEATARRPAISRSICRHPRRRVRSTAWSPRSCRASEAARNLRHARPAPPRAAGVRADVAVLPAPCNFSASMSRASCWSPASCAWSAGSRCGSRCSTAFVFTAVMFVTFEIAFDVIMPKGPARSGCSAARQTGRWKHSDCCCTASPSC